ncbi:MAG: BsuPI-related putative proteinase inhibitor [Povalibacter sp.]
MLPLLVAFTLMMGSGWVSCSYNSPNTAANLPNTPGHAALSFATELDLKDDTGQSRRVFAAGELIHMILTVRNRLPETVQVDMATSRTYDFIVVRENTDTIIWQWSNLHPEVRTPTTIAFGPGETQTFEVVWNQLNNAGLPVALGGFEARGAIVYQGFDINPMQPNQLASPPVKFVIQ